MKDNPKVGVAVNCFNHEPFIKDCVTSIMKQSYINYEVNFYDSNSTDRSRELLYEYTKHHDNFRLDKPIGGGILPIGVARFNAVQPFMHDSSIKYIAIMDADDIWLSNKLKMQVEALEYNRKEAVCFSDCYYLHWKQGVNQVDGYPVFVEGKVYSEVRGTFHNKYPVIYTEDPFMDILTKYNFMPCPTLMFDKDVFKRCIKHPTHYTSAEDYDWILRILAEHNAFTNVALPLAKYRIHDNQLTQRSSARCTMEEIDVVKNAMNYRDLTKEERRRVYWHLIWLYFKLIYKEGVWLKGN